MTGSSALILVVDDELQIQRFLRHALEAAGYRLVFADRGAAALRLATSEEPDLIILDLGLPDLDGKVVLGQLRQTSDVPVIVLSARDDDGEKIAALDLGANDYVAKPFSIGELLARVRVLLRAKRAERADDGTIQMGALVIDPSKHEVRVNNALVKLTPTEFEILVFLASHSGRVLTHRQILTRIWGPAHTEDVAYLRVFIGQLRQKIESNPAAPRFILTEPGIGYKASPVDGPRN